MDQNSETAAESSPWPKEVFAVTLFVEDLDAATQFYRQVFGLPVVFETDNSSVFQIGADSDQPAADHRGQRTG